MRELAALGPSLWLALVVFSLPGMTVGAGFVALAGSAERAGIAVFADSADWVGKAVSAGERVLVGEAGLAVTIGEHVAELIPDEATLQMGIGEIPDAVLLFLKEKRDLGIHTEMFSDGVVELFEAGVITGEAKTLHRGKTVASFVLGTKRAFDFMDNNPFLEFHPSDYVNDPFVIAQNNKQVAINSAIEVDLTGQVAADTIGAGEGEMVLLVRGSSARMVLEGKTPLDLSVIGKRSCSTWSNTTVRLQVTARTTKRSRCRGGDHPDATFVPSPESFIPRISAR